MKFGFLLGGQEEKVVSCGLDSEFRSMAEDCEGSNVRVKDCIVGSSKFQMTFDDRAVTNIWCFRYRSSVLAGSDALLA